MHTKVRKGELQAIVSRQAGRPTFLLVVQTSYKLNARDSITAKFSHLRKVAQLRRCSRMVLYFPRAVRLARHAQSEASLRIILGSGPLDSFSQGSGASCCSELGGSCEALCICI